MNDTKIGRYIFRDGILEPQVIEKGVLAYFYSRTANTFRSELQRKGIATDGGAKTYTTAEAEQIFAEFGPIYYEDALEGWKKYILFRQKKQKYNRKHSTRRAKGKQNHTLTTFSIF